MTEYDILFAVVAEEVRKIVEYAIEIRGLVHEATEWWPKVQRHIQIPIVYRSILSKARRHIPLLEDLKKEIDVFDSLMVRSKELSQGMIIGGSPSTVKIMVQNVDCARGDVKKSSHFMVM